MTQNEVQTFMARNPAVFYKVWAAAKPSHADIMEHRFPGLSFTGYFIEDREHIMIWFDYLIIDRIEVW